MPNPTKTELPKGQVMFCDTIGQITRDPICKVYPVAVLPCHTRRQARAQVEWHGKTREEKLNIISQIVFACGPKSGKAAAILNLTEGEP